MYTGFFVVSYAILCYAILSHLLVEYDCSRLGAIFLARFLRCEEGCKGKVSKSRHWVGGMFLIVRMGVFGNHGNMKLMPTNPSLTCYRLDLRAQLRARPTVSLAYSLALSTPLHPASSATISAQRSPIAKTVSMGFTLVISGNTPASATRTRLSPRSLNRGSTTAISSVAKSPIFVVPAGW